MKVIMYSPWPKRSFFDIALRYVSFAQNRTHKRTKSYEVRGSGQPKHKRPIVAVVTLLLSLGAPAQNESGNAIALLAFIPAYGQSSNPPSPQAGAQASPDVINVLRRQGIDAFRAGDYAGALRIFRQVIHADPSDIVAYNVAANCSLNLGDYSSAIESFQHALQLRPDEYHNLGGLMRAYTLAGMSTDRDALRKHIGELVHEGKLPPEFNYVFDTFQVEGKKVEVAEFPQTHGFYGERYRFKLFDSAGKQTFCVTLESDSVEQPAWAKQHPKEAAAGGRQFSLDGYAADSHSTYRSYDGEPSYDQVRAEVIQILAGKKQPVSKTKYAMPQPIPGAD